MSDPVETPKPRRLLRRGMFSVAGIVIIWLAGDLICATVIATRYRAWEAKIERDVDGVREGCQEFSLGEGPTAILLVHGINDSPACYKEMAQALAKRGYHCRAMRMPGFAEPLEKYAASNREQWLDSVSEELKNLRESHSQVVIVAHSLGGAVAINLLLASPTAADAAVLLAPAVNVASDRSPVLSPAAWHGIANYLLLFTSATESPFGLDAQVANDETYPYRSPFTPRTIFDQTFALIEANRGRAAQFTTPLLMILSPDDVVIDVEAAREFFDSSAAEPKAMVDVGDTGHSMTVDHQWSLIVEEIDFFVHNLQAEDPPRAGGSDEATENGQ